MIFQGEAFAGFWIDLTGQQVLINSAFMTPSVFVSRAAALESPVW